MFDEPVSPDFWRGLVLLNQLLHKLFTANISCSHTFQMRRMYLAVYHCYLFPYAGVDKRDKSSLGSITDFGKHGFSKKALCPISQDDLIIHFFSRKNLYEVPCVTVLTLGLENDINKNKFHPLFVTYEISI